MSLDLSWLPLVSIIAIALIFDFTNGFHDAANAIATVVATRTLTLRQALLMAACFNWVGALSATGVATTIASGLVDNLGDPLTSQGVILAALAGGIGWNLVTWGWGLPSSSSHALIGGLVGAAWAAGHGRNIHWMTVRDKVALPMMTSPLLAALVAVVFMSVVSLRWRSPSSEKTDAPPPLRTILYPLHIGAGALMAFAHGSNDAQKTMGIMTLTLIAAGRLPVASPIPVWVIGLCAAALAIGTYGGGRRIIQTIGVKITDLDPQSGLVANLSGSLTVLGASFLGIPVSTTHVVVGAITGAGWVAHRQHRDPRAQVAEDVSMAPEPNIRWSIWRRMGLAWVLTLPGSGLIGAGTYLVWNGCAEWLGTMVR